MEGVLIFATVLPHDDDSERLAKDLHEFVAYCRQVYDELRRLADEIDKHRKNCHKGKIAGSATSIAGFTLVAVGFGLSFVTFGASLGLSIAGGVMSGAGGVAAAGSHIADHVLTKKRCKRAQEAYDAALKKYERVQASYENQRERRSVSVPNSRGAVLSGFKLSKDAGVAVGTSVVSGLRLAAGVADDTAGIAGSAAAGAGTVFKSLGTGLRVVHIGGFAVSAVLLPLDIYTLVSSAVKLARDEKADEAETLREVAKQFIMPDNFVESALEQILQF